MIQILKKRYKAFTLIELMIVVSLVSMLSTAIMNTVGSARFKSKNTRIRAEMIQLRNQAEIYQVTNDNYTNLHNDPKYLEINNSIINLSGSGAFQGFNNASDWVASARLIKKQNTDPDIYFCIGSRLASGYYTATPATSGNFDCPAEINPATYGGSGGGGGFSMPAFDEFWAHIENSITSDIGVTILNDFINSQIATYGAVEPQFHSSECDQGLFDNGIINNTDISNFFLNIRSHVPLNGSNQLKAICQVTSEGWFMMFQASDETDDSGHNPFICLDSYSGINGPYNTGGINTMNLGLKEEFLNQGDSLWDYNGVDKMNFLVSRAQAYTGYDPGTQNQISCANLM